jgi:hypothetical protein
VNPSPIPEDPTSTADHFATLANRRQSRERMRTAFLTKVERTSRPHRRWFRISEIETDESVRQELIRLWRASIHSGDLNFKGKLQVLCLTESPLVDGYRFPINLARGELFNEIINDLWMSAPRWREWFHQIKKTPPHWLALAGKKSWKPKLGKQLTKSDYSVLSALSEFWPDGHIGQKASERNQVINDWLKKNQKRRIGSRTIQRALTKVRFVN